MEEFIVDHLKQSFMKWRKTHRFVPFHVPELCVSAAYNSKKTRHSLNIFGIS